MIVYEYIIVLYIQVLVNNIHLFYNKNHMIMYIYTGFRYIIKFIYKFAYFIVKIVGLSLNMVG